MKIYLVTGLLFLLSGCNDGDEFTPKNNYLYSPVWKIWEIRYVDESSTANTSVLRDINSRYIFTDSITFVSSNEGASYINYKTRHLSLDSISFGLITPQINDQRSYVVTNMYVMNDPTPPADSIRDVRDRQFPELKNKFLFLRLKNNKKVKIENREMTEFLLLYN